MVSSLQCFKCKGSTSVSPCSWIIFLISAHHHNPAPPSFQKFRFCGALRSPDWLLAEISILSKLVGPVTAIRKLIQRKAMHECTTESHAILEGRAYRSGYRTSKPLITVALTGNKLVPSPNPNPGPC